MEYCDVLNIIASYSTVIIIIIIIIILIQHHLLTYLLIYFAQFYSYKISHGKTKENESKYIKGKIQFFKTLRAWNLN